MTLIKLQEVLGERITITTNPSMSAEERRKEAEISQTIASLAKQMINNADIVIRADRLKTESKIDGAMIDSFIYGREKT